MPYPMAYYPKAAVLKGRMYIGGGRVHSASQADTHVMVYDIEGDTWSTLPPYVYVYFSLATLNKCLVLGGWKR